MTQQPLMGIYAMGDSGIWGYVMGFFMGVWKGIPSGKLT